MSNQDIVRIYVPPADEMIPDRSVHHRERGDDEISQCSNRSSIVHVEYETLPFERSAKVEKPPTVSQRSPSKPDQTSPGANKFQPQQYYYYPNPSQTVYQSSSSRRGSMSRKSPSPLLNELIVECDHMKIRKSQENVSEDLSGRFYQFNNNNNTSGSLKRLTSFEELAKKSESNSLLYITETSPDNNFRRTSSVNKPKSDYNICYNYKSLESREELDYSKLMMKKSTSHSYNIKRGVERKHSSSDNSPFDYDLLKDKRKDNRFMYDNEGRQVEGNENSIKSYDRFFNSEDEMEEDEIRSARATKKNSSNAHKYHRTHISGTEADDDDENSSNSPTNKSIVNTPMNETMPLLSHDADATQILYHSSAPPPVLPSSSGNSLRRKSKIPRPNRSNNNSMRKNSSVSSPDGSDKSDGYQTSVNRYDNRVAQSVGYQPPLTTERNGSTSRSDNKIRIKINQKN